MDTARFSTGYMDRALDDLDAVIEDAKRALTGVDFDTIVGTGFSGSVVIPTLAREMGKHFLLIRKDSDDSHHGSGRPIGMLGSRWIFVDDFVSSGNTRRRVHDKVEEFTQGFYDWRTGKSGHVTTYVGDWMYVGGNGKFESVEDINSTPRSYCIGLPVVITVHDDDTVTYEIDYSEATDLWDGAPTHSDGLTPIYDDELIEADIDRVSADIARRNQAARTRLADEAADAVSLGRLTKDDDRG